VEVQKPRRAKSILQKKNGVEGHLLPDFKAHYNFIETDNMVLASRWMRE
jgi:hypothetical protein